MFNATSSIAGAGSGEFNIYRNQRNREASRQARMDHEHKDVSIVQPLHLLWAAAPARSCPNSNFPFADTNLESSQQQHREEFEERAKILKNYADAITKKKREKREKKKKKQMEAKLQKKALK